MSAIHAIWNAAPKAAKLGTVKPFKQVDWNHLAKIYHKGRTVRFVTSTDCLADLVKQESLPALEPRTKRYTSPDFTDNRQIGYLPRDNHVADILSALLYDATNPAPSLLSPSICMRSSALDIAMNCMLFFSTMHT